MFTKHAEPFIHAENSRSSLSASSFLTIIYKLRCVVHDFSTILIETPYSHVNRVIVRLCLHVELYMPTVWTRYNGGQQSMSSDSVFRFSATIYERRSLCSWICRNKSDDVRPKYIYVNLCDWCSVIDANATAAAFVLILVTLDHHNNARLLGRKYSAGVIAYMLVLWQTPWWWYVADRKRANNPVGPEQQ